MKIRNLAFVHDDFIQLGGAEFFAFDIIRELKKQQDLSLKVFSPVISRYWKDKFLELDVEYEESFLGKIPFIEKVSKVFFLTPLFYLACESFDFTNYDIVLSSSTRFAHSVVTRPETLHISYINSPSKTIWEVKKYFYGKEFLYGLIKNFLPDKRTYDFYTHQRADVLVSNSVNIFEKVKSIYRRESFVLYPFINTQNKISHKEKSDYYLLVSRLVPWKRVDYVVEAFNENCKNLIIIGQGDKKHISKLKSKAKKNISFLGFVSGDEKFIYLSKAQGLIVPQDEDFGLILLEALNFGTPIIYFNKGGAKEVLSKEVGTSYEFQNSTSLTEALKVSEGKDYNELSFKQNLQKFSKEEFVKNLYKIMNTRNL